MQTQQQLLHPEHLQRIGNWNGWEIVQQVAAKEYEISEEQFMRLLPEYQRFLGLAAQCHHLGMFSAEIDKLWHSHLLCTQLYATFCQQVIGRFVHHLPTLSQHAEICSDTPCKTTCKTPAPCSDNCTTPSDKEAKGTDAHTFVHLYQDAYGEAPSALWNLPIADALAMAS